MKSIISFVLLLFFLAGNSYAGINIHYCGGELQSISLITKSKSCGMCGKETSKKSCCKDIQKILKADDFSKVQTHFSIQKFLIQVSSLYFNFVKIVYDQFLQNVFLFFGDPPKLKTPLFIRFNSLII